MLWLGWFGFHAGSAVAANGRAGMAMLVDQLAAAVGALPWIFIELSPIENLQELSVKLQEVFLAQKVYA